MLCLKGPDFIAEAMKDRVLDTIYRRRNTYNLRTSSMENGFCGRVHYEVSCASGEGICVEAGRPDSITHKNSRQIRKFPVTRISVNPQT